jgi:hypothetical protein
LNVLTREAIHATLQPHTFHRRKKLKTLPFAEISQIAGETGTPGIQLVAVGFPLGSGEA